MNSYHLSELNIYPVKSLGGISVRSAEVTDRGLGNDRRWMIVDKDGKFLTQRTHPQMALIKTKIIGSKLILSHKTKDILPLVILINSESLEIMYVNIWDDLVEARLVGKYAEEWLSEALGIGCKLVYMPEETLRYVDNNFASNNEIVSFADAYPFLIIGQSSLDDLNSRLEEKLQMNRFRPNLVFTGGEPFEEDTWKKFKIGNVIFFGIKQCLRCKAITINQETAEKQDEPLKTLSKYRTFDNKVMFGMNVIHEGIGSIRVGDIIEILERQ